MAAFRYVATQTEGIKNIPLDPPSKGEFCICPFVAKRVAMGSETGIFPAVKYDVKRRVLGPRSHPNSEKFTTNFTSNARARVSPFEGGSRGMFLAGHCQTITTTRDFETRSLRIHHINPNQ